MVVRDDAEVIAERARNHVVAEVRPGRPVGHVAAVPGQQPLQHLLAEAASLGLRVTVLLIGIRVLVGATPAPQLQISGLPLHCVAARVLQNPWTTPVQWGHCYRQHHRA